MLFSSSNPLKRISFHLLKTSLLASLAFATSAHAASVTLSNGDQISGKVVSLTDGELKFASPVFGSVTIPFAKVSRLVTDSGDRIELKDGRTVSGQMVLAPNGQLKIDQGNLGQSEPLARRDLAAINPPVIDKGVKYTGHLNVGGSFNRGNSRDNLLNVNGEFVARTPSDRYTVGLEINEGQSQGVTTTSNSRLLTQYDAFLSKKNYLFVNFKAEKDKLADLNLRTSLGGGYGRQFVDTDLTQLSGEAGLSYVNEDYILAADRSFPTLTLGLKYNRKFFDKKLVFFNNTNLDTNLQDTSDMLLHNRLGIRVPVADHVNLSTQFNVDYDRKPAVGKKRTDSALIFSVGYGF